MTLQCGNGSREVRKKAHKEIVPNQTRPLAFGNTGQRPSRPMTLLDNRIEPARHHVWDGHRIVHQQGERIAEGRVSGKEAWNPARLVSAVTQDF
jgi:hypothetical protein